MKNSILLVPFLLALAACGPGPSDESAPVATESAAATAAQLEVTPTVMLHAEPAILTTCNADKVLLKWDVRKEKPDVSTIKIYTAEGKLFAHAGASGQQETGPWVKPGAVFVIKDATTDAEFEKLTIGGPVCP